jgi:hypothetical protein
MREDAWGGERQTFTARNVAAPPVAVNGGDYGRGARKLRGNLRFRSRLADREKEGARGGGDRGAGAPPRRHALPGRARTIQQMSSQEGSHPLASGPSLGHDMAVGSGQSPSPHDSPQFTV